MTPSVVQHRDDVVEPAAAVFLVEWEIKATIVKFGKEAFADCNGSDEYDITEDLYRKDEVNYSGTSSFAYASVARANSAAECMFENFKETFLDGFHVNCIDFSSDENEEDDKEEEGYHVVRISQDETSGGKSWKWYFHEKEGAYENIFLHQGTVSLRRIEVVE